MRATQNLYYPERNGARAQSKDLSVLPRTRNGVSDRMANAAIAEEWFCESRLRTHRRSG